MWFSLKRLQWQEQIVQSLCCYMVFNIWDDGKEKKPLFSQKQSHKNKHVSVTMLKTRNEILKKQWCKGQSPLRCWRKCCQDFKIHNVYMTFETFLGWLLWFLQWYYDNRERITRRVLKHRNAAFIHDLNGEVHGRILLHAHSSSVRLL